MRGRLNYHISPAQIRNQAARLDLRSLSATSVSPAPCRARVKESNLSSFGTSMWTRRKSLSPRRLRRYLAVRDARVIFSSSAHSELSNLARASIMSAEHARARGRVRRSDKSNLKR